MKHRAQSPRARLLQRAALLVTLISPLLASAAAPSKCKLMTVAQIPIDLRNSRPVISAMIDGHTASMLVDSGSSLSLIFRSAAAAFGMKIVETGGKGYAVGGVEYSGVVTVKDFDVAGFVVHNVNLAAMGHGNVYGGVAGLLGEDVLSHWDLELDPAAGVMRLIVPKDCTGDQVVYWAPDYSVANLVPVWSHLLEANVQLNGHDVLAMFDTGASHTTVGTEVAKRPGLRPMVEATTGVRAQGLARDSVVSNTAVFPSITIGQETIQNPKLRVADMFSKDKEVTLGSFGSRIASTPEGVPEILIGMDFFRAHHVYVARGQKKLYFTYVGGPVFLTDNETAAKAQPGAPPADATPGPAATPVGQTPGPAAPPPGETPNRTAPK